MRGRPDLGRRRRSSTASPTRARFAHRIIGVDARTGRALLDFPHGRVRPRLRQRRPPAPARLLAAVRRGAESGEAAALIGARLVLVVLARRRPRRRLRPQALARAADVRGSSTEEFVTTEARSPPAPTPTRSPGSSGRRTATTRSGSASRRASSSSRRSARVWTFKRAEARRVPARGRATGGSTSRTTPASCSRSTRRRASARGARARPLRRGLARASPTTPSTRPS